MMSEALSARSRDTFRPQSIAIELPRSLGRNLDMDDDLLIGES